ncbi:MAG: hypothetical protein RLZZ553_433, partial [Verrucomicrobiota bacterium]
MNYDDKNFLFGVYSAIRFFPTLS